MEEVRKFRGIYILPALYVIVAYGFGLLAYRLPGMELEKHMGEQLATAVWILQTGPCTSHGLLHQDHRNRKIHS